MPVLLIDGDNALEIGEAVRAVREPFNPADVLTYDGTAVSPPDLSAACLTAGLFDPQRLVIVENLHERLKGSRSEADSAIWQEIIGGVAPTTTLLLLAPEMPADHPLGAMVKASGGEIRTFTVPRKRDLPRWVMDRARKRGASMLPEAAELLVDLVGASSVMLESEVEKLATYADGEPITPTMVDALVGQVTQESIFSLVDAIAAGDRAGAFRLLHAQRAHASSTPTDFALYLIRMLARQVRILLGIRLGQKAGKSQSQLVSELRLPRYYADRYFRQARRLSQERLASSFERLASLEHGLKTGTVDAGAGLDMLVAELCG